MKLCPDSAHFIKRRDYPPPPAWKGTPAQCGWGRQAVLWPGDHESTTALLPTTTTWLQHRKGCLPNDFLV